MKIYASSDLHLDQPENYLAFLDAFKNPCEPKAELLILAGDICESEKQLREILSIVKQSYREVIWVPGNHELWIRPSEVHNYTGSEDKYFRMVSICQALGVFTPEDAFFETEEYIFVALFLLYDYSFRPAHISEDKAVEWAMESNVLCTDEVLIRAQPYASIPKWCESRVVQSFERLTATVNPDKKLVLINHFPLREDSFYLARIPRFSIWCGTRKTEHWHQQFPCAAVINGHLHLPGVQSFDGIPFYEVSLGYPGQWDSNQSMKDLFTEIIL